MRNRVKRLGAGSEPVLQRLLSLRAGTDSARLYHTPVGLKARNQLVHSDMLSYPFLSVRQLGDGDPGDLILGLDGLRDEYTLFGCPIGQSPHKALMEALVEGRGGEDLKDHPYVIRSREGTLDLRLPREVTEPMLRDSFDRSFGQIATGRKPVIKVVRFAGHCYIADGKHRAALATVTGTSVEREDVTPVLYDSFFDWMRRKMEEQSADYTKQLALLREVEESRAGAGEIIRE